MKTLRITVVLIVVASGSAYAYDTGSLTCQRIGELAAETVNAKQSGVSDSASLSVLMEPLAADAKAERRLLTNMVEIIYRNELLAAMKPSDAYIVFLRDCMTGKSQSETR